MKVQRQVSLTTPSADFHNYAHFSGKLPAVASSTRARRSTRKRSAKNFGVRYLLEGSVRRLGETVEVNAQLISTETGAHVWADRFEEERSNLGKLQFEIVGRQPQDHVAVALSRPSQMTQLVEDVRL
jgi:hypothetical protein